MKFFMENYIENNKNNDRICNLIKKYNQVLNNNNISLEDKKNLTYKIKIALVNYIS
jgi:hypothetical protein